MTYYPLTPLSQLHFDRLLLIGIPEEMEIHYMFLLLFSYLLRLSLSAALSEQFINKHRGPSNPITVEHATMLGDLPMTSKS